VNGTGSLEVRCPIASGSPTGSAPTSNPGASNPPSQADATRKPTSHRHRMHRPSETPRLSLTLTASTGRARPGSVIAYRITVANSGGSAARNLEVCDQPPAGQRVLRTMPSADDTSEPCWEIKTLAAGAQRVFRATAMVEPDSSSEVQRDRATTSAANAKGVRADQVAVRIRALPETACGSRLARPVTWPLGSLSLLSAPDARPPTATRALHAGQRPAAVSSSSG
jgi:uncharacterized repeat protein (TIGR01451 family)